MFKYKSLMVWAVLIVSVTQLTGQTVNLERVNIQNKNNDKEEKIRRPGKLVKVEFILADFFSAEEWAVRGKKNAKVNLSYTDDETRESSCLVINYQFQHGNGRRPVISLVSKKIRELEFHRIDNIKIWYRGDGSKQNLKIFIEDSTGEKLTSRKQASSMIQSWSSVDNPFTTGMMRSFGGNKDLKQDGPVKLFQIMLQGTKGAITNGWNTILIDKLVVIGEVEQAYAEKLKLKIIKKDVIASFEQKNALVKIEIEDRGSYAPITLKEVGIFRVTLNNLKNVPQDLTLKIINNKLLGFTEINELKVKLAAEGHKTISLPLTIKDVGVYEVTVSALAKNGQIIGQGKRTVNVWEPMGNTYKDVYPYFFGAMANDTFWQATDIENMRNCGIKIVRTIFRWSKIEPQKGLFKWGRYDSIVDDCRKNNIMLEPMLVQSPEWAYDRDVYAKHPYGQRKPKMPPGNMSDWANFLEQVVTRYKDYIKTWEIWNEPNAHHSWYGGTADDYVDMLKISWLVIKKIDPDAQVVVGSVGSGEFAETVAAKGGAFYDILAWHTKGSVEKVEGVYKSVMKIQRKNKLNKIIWFDEPGIRTDPFDPIGELHKAEVTIKQIAYTRFEKIENYMMFIWRHQAKSSIMPTDNYPGLDYEGRIRPVIIAYNTAVRNLRGTIPVKKIDMKKKADAYLFKRDQKDQVLMIWAKESGKGLFVNIYPSKDFDKIELCDLFGSRKVLTPRNGRISLPIDIYPQYIIVNKGAIVKTELEQLLDTPERLVNISGQDFNVEIQINNIFNKTLTIDWSIDGGDKWQCRPEKGKVSLDARQKKKLIITIKSTKPTAALEYILFNSNIKEAGNIKTRLKVFTGIKIEKNTKIKIDGSFADWQTVPLKLLNKRTHVYEFFVGEADQELLWNGPEDLSGKVYVTYDAQNIYVACEVTDDIYNQKNTPERMYLGDSIQYAFEGTLGKAKVELQLGMGLINGKPVIHKWKGTLDMSKSGIKYAVKRKGRKIFYELAVPFKDLECVYEPGKVILFSLLINDNDGRGRKVIMEYGKGIHGRSVSKMIPLVLK